jgi:hypothetical protein
VSLKNVELLDASDALLERIEAGLTLLERELTLIDCRVTIEGADGPCRVQVRAQLPEQREAESSASGTDLCSLVDGVFEACRRIVL